MIGDGKYVVFKADEFRAWYNDVLKDSVPGIPMALDDATVIRAQDVFAAPALYAYSNSILVALEVARVMEGNGEPTEITRRLMYLADYFHSAAVQAEQTDYKKIPD